MRNKFGKNIKQRWHDFSRRKQMVENIHYRTISRTDSIDVP